AEDGIRDFHVTGVQTCALPISRARCSPACCSPNTAGTRPIWRAPPSSRSRSAWPCTSYRSVRGPAVAEEDQGRRAVFAPLALLRSEERRVGKEWRSSWGAQ